MGNVGIYKITSPIGSVYIGQSHNIHNRIRDFRITIDHHRKLYSSVLEYGWDAHKAEVIHQLPKDVSQQVLDTYEVLYMQAYKDCGIELLNIREGGRNGKHPEETRVKLSEARKGQNPFMKGKRHSSESKSKMSESQKKRYIEHPVVITESRRIELVEAARKMREARKDWTSPMKGKHHSQESKDKVSQTKKGCKGTQNKKIICSNTGKIYESIKDAAISIGMEPNTLRMQLRGNNTNRTSFNFLIN